jgi:hypothetical protein
LEAKKQGGPVVITAQLIDRHSMEKMGVREVRVSSRNVGKKYIERSRRAKTCWCVAVVALDHEGMSSMTNSGPIAARKMVAGEAATPGVCPAPGASAISRGLPLIPQHAHPPRRPSSTPPVPFQKQGARVVIL